jgi:hypothetical protein
MRPLPEVRSRTGCQRDHTDTGPINIACQRRTSESSPEAERSSVHKAGAYHRLIRPVASDRHATPSLLWCVQLSMRDCDATQQKARVTSFLSAFGPIPSAASSPLLTHWFATGTDPPHVCLEPTQEGWQDPVMTSHAPLPPSGQHATADCAAEGDGDRPRADLNIAIASAPAEVQQLIIDPCGEALSLIHTSLEDAPNSVELRWRPDDHQATFTVSS